ncbi:MAG: hypothetical protein KGV59_05455 [Tenacibaculum sp.]|nr:hypothetical protein [Tenacibaculum sp.]
MATVDLVKKRQTVNTDNDTIIIVDCFETVRGGRTLDVEGFPNKVIVAGHPIIKDGDVYKPMAIDGSNGDKAVGILISSVSVEKPLGAIMVRGSVNVGAFTETTTIEIPESVKTKLNLINFV